MSTQRLQRLRHAPSVAPAILANKVVVFEAVHGTRSAEISATQTLNTVGLMASRPANEQPLLLWPRPRPHAPSVARVHLANEVVAF